MTTDEALAAVKKAHSFLKWADEKQGQIIRNESVVLLSVEQFELLTGALRAIGPGGPLCVVSREKIERAIRFTVDPAPTTMTDRKVLDWVNQQLRAMLAASEKQT